MYFATFTKTCCFIFQIKFLNPMISRKTKLQRQPKIFKQQGKNLNRPININVATWGRLIRRGRNQSSTPLTPTNANMPTASTPSNSYQHSNILNNNAAQGIFFINKHKNDF